jgi:hypothetical protein
LSSREAGFDEANGYYESSWGGKKCGKKAGKKVGNGHRKGSWT